MDGGFPHPEIPRLFSETSKKLDIKNFLWYTFVVKVTKRGKEVNLVVDKMQPEGYEKPTLVELGSILQLTEGLFHAGDADDDNDGYVPNSNN